MRLVAVVACDYHRLIGRAGELPWHCPEDLHSFKRLTTGRTLLMGRRTFDSILRRLGRPLPERESLVLTTGSGEPRLHVRYLAYLEAALAWPEDLYVIGGGSVYTQCAAYFETIYLSLIPGVHTGDTYLSDLGSDWRLEARERFSSFSLLTLRRSSAHAFDWSHLEG